MGAEMRGSWVEASLIARMPSNEVAPNSIRFGRVVVRIEATGSFITFRERAMPWVASLRSQ
ncbi:hypothetical protein [Methylobacterium pseudosasicola]|uniref:hypothetical protein n=1 Tax=Methylobacterium pseudosasicola TaxID=582667 RepID=UPI0011133142|nr:hypothetical protein [Methylobacterium pseudosasicola]